MALLRDREGRLWVGTLGEGLFRERESGDVRAVAMAEPVWMRPRKFSVWPRMRRAPSGSAAETGCSDTMQRRTD